jgi:K+-sensing histidine kinase KdpD
MRELDRLIPAGFVLAIGACAVAAPVFSESTARVVVVGAAVGMFGFWAGRYLAALAAGVMTWCFATAFLVNTGGRLTFERHDLARLAAFAVAAIVGCAGGHARRALRSRRRLRMRTRAGVRHAPVLLSPRLRTGLAPFRDLENLDH